MIASSARQLVVAHDQYGCASRSAFARACSSAASTPARSPSSRRSSTIARCAATHALGRDRATRQARAPRVRRRRAATVPAGPIERDPTRLQSGGEIVGVVAAPRFAEAALGELVALGLGVGEHECERKLTEHRDEEVDVAVVEPGERFAEERRARRVRRDRRRRRRPPPPTSASDCRGRGPAATVRTRDTRVRSRSSTGPRAA